ncbi:MAG: FkbM family methyltransferase, partial [Phaeodactylibacter sp.]|nr:FkbM family methyltransferase [Phaeodactylibacter sp.]
GRFANKETIIGAVEQYMKYEKQAMAGNGLDLAAVDRKAVETYYEQIDADTGMTEEMKQYLSNLYTTEEVDCRLLPLSEVIDDLGIQAIDLLKVDVEKSERLVLEGIRQEQWPMIRQLVIEVDGDDNLQFIQGLLLEKGYQLQVDELAMSDTEAANEENTYLLYARHPQFGRQSNKGAIHQIGAQVNENLIRDELRKQLPEYMIPKDIALVEAIPLMENGKVDLLKLKSMKSEQAVLQKEKSSLTPMELAVYQLWCEVLKKENIPYHISIFEAGGSSIEMVLLHEKMRKHFNIDFSLIELFRKPTLEQQAQLIQSLTARQEVKEDQAADKALEKGAMRRNVRRKNREHNQ